jgi:hypothetical protein
VITCHQRWHAEKGWKGYAEAALAEANATVDAQPDKVSDIGLLACWLAGWLASLVMSSALFSA